MGGGIKVTIKNFKALQKQIKKIDKAGEKSIKSTVSDFKSRAPAQVSSAVVENYGLSRSDVKKALKGTKPAEGTTKLAGRQVDNIALVYSGRVLTPTHFKMKPSTPAAAIGKDITAEIKKGSRKALSPGRAFLGENGAGGAIPFQRTGDSRYPIEAIKTLSVPQTITNPEVSEKASEKIDELIKKRLEHHAQRELDKL